MNYWKLDGNYLVFQPNGYEVPLQYIFTPEHLVIWVLCLSEKRWGTPLVIGEFLTTANSWMLKHTRLCSSIAICNCPHCIRTDISQVALLVESKRRSPTSSWTTPSNC
ncbi:hypothetical protein ACN23B_28335 (plasmid) [Anabaena sp. FACHB-709]|uniref:Uncharacterized protein n=1 Tax=Trichormus variabilis NIES-23 TaxID=1973479 RepID=A0A1Z4KV83_ANAVA|nr:MULTISPECIES: hypothetical protein [Nostocaceae]MBD2266892.1 hypothetical protein [Anabaena sp. FACHB-709]MBD2276467.1 hypothetical protein [Nostoc sp. PCC 7120 = FACHB-418]BAB78357.1 all7273 [Nostoc sp. PCC 7120 = FACHB-418]BAY72926.1 hypothetical protein NIES23_57540 [Trichormus variabilis NIES-23]